jgi:hypothetical protein
MSGGAPLAFHRYHASCADRGGGVAEAMRKQIILRGAGLCCALRFLPSLYPDGARLIELRTIKSEDIDGDEIKWGEEKKNILWR